MRCINMDLDLNLEQTSEQIRKLSLKVSHRNEVLAIKKKCTILMSVFSNQVKSGKSE